MVKRVLHALEGTDNSVTVDQVEYCSADPAGVIDGNERHHSVESDYVAFNKEKLNENQRAKYKLADKC